MGIWGTNRTTLFRKGVVPPENKEVGGPIFQNKEKDQKKKGVEHVLSVFFVGNPEGDCLEKDKRREKLPYSI